MSTSSWLQKYEQFLLKNASQISSIESSLRSLVLILPGRFQDAEIASESVSSALQIIGLYHDSILAKAARSAGQTNEAVQESQHNKYTTAQSDQSSVYKVVSLTLTIIRFTELLAETTLKQKKGNEARWKAIVAIEAVKSALRLVLVGSTRRILMSPPIPEREFDPQQLETELKNKEQEVNQILEGVPTPDLPGPNSPWCMPRTGKYLPATTPGTPQDIQTYLTSKVLTAEDVCKPVDLAHPLVQSLTRWMPFRRTKPNSNSNKFEYSAKGLYSELVYILRPLVYALVAYKYRSRPKNWTPWVVGLALELYARRLQQDYYKQELGSSVTSLEKDEAKKRTAALWWWLFRGAMYENKVRPIVHSMASRAEKVPIVSLFGSLAQDYLYLLDHYHFASSTL